MDDAGPRIDEDCRRRFEACRRSGGSDPPEAFLPPEGSPARADTLEELVKIEIELRWKAWDGTGEPPSADDVAARHPSLGADAVRRIRDEADLVAARFARRRPAAPGVRVGRHVLLERVGRGASAEVWRARDEELGRDVAVKLTREELAGDELVVARLLREARSTAQLRHPGIVAVHEVATHDGQPYIVSDFIEGPTLAHEIARRVFTPDEAAAVVARLADALDYAHACGVVHRDVKPGNVLLAAEGRPVLADFGLAQLARAEAGLTRAGDLLGTPAYMAPEQARGDVAHVDARSDVYALGAVLYELLAGRPPFTGATAAGVIAAVVRDGPEPLATVRPDVPADLATICAKAMAREPSDRYAAARDLADDLRRFLARQPVAARPPGPWRRVLLWTRRNPALAATLAGSAAVVVAVAAVAFDRVVEERDRVRANLYRALVGEADARLAALDTGWYERTRAAVRQAGALDVSGRDVVALRDLAVRCEGVARPSFEQVAVLAPHGGAVRDVAAVPGGALVAGIGAPDEVWIRSVADGSLVASRRIAGAALRALAVRPDGTALVAAGDAGCAYALAVPDLREIGALAGAASADGADVWSCAVRDGGAALGLADGRIRMLDLGDGGLAPAAAFDAHEGGVLALAFSPDGARLASAGRDATLAEWDTTTLALVARAPQEDGARSVRYSADGRSLAWAAPESLGFGLRGPDGASERRGSLHESGVRDVLFGRGGCVVTASADGTLRAWSAKFAPLAVADAAAGPVVCATACAADGPVVAAHDDGRLRVWRLTESGARAFFGSPHVAVFVPGSRRLFTGTAVLDVEADADRVAVARSRRVSDAAAHPLRAWGAAARPDASLVASCGHAGAVRLLDPATGALVANLQERGELAWTVAFSPDGATLAASSGNDAVLFDVASRAARARLAGHELLVTGIAFHPSAPLVVTVSLDRTVRAWDPRDGAALATLARFPATLHGATFSPDGIRLAVAVDDGTVAIWDAAPPGFGRDGAAREPARRLTGHEGAAWAAGWSRDGALFASCDDRGRTVLRDGRTLGALVTLRADVHRGRSVAFDDASRLLAVGCFDGPSVVWDLAALRRRLAELGLDW